MSTVHVLLTEWLEREEIEAASPEISADLLRSLKVGIAKAIRNANEEGKQALDRARSQRDEAVIMLNEIEDEKSKIEKKVTDLDEQLSALHKNVGEQSVKLTEMSAANATLIDEKCRLEQELYRVSEERAASIAKEGALQQMCDKLLVALSQITGNVEAIEAP